MKSVTALIIVVTVFFIIDLYLLRGVKILAGDLLGKVALKPALIAHAVVFVLFSGAMIFAFTNSTGLSDHRHYIYYYFLFGFTLLIYIPKLFFGLFMLADDLILGIQKLALLFSRSDPETPDPSRLKFLYRIGAVAAAVPFAAAAYGMLKGRWDFRVIRETVTSPDLPESFNGLKIAQFSDAHLGSFFENHKPVEEALRIINDLKPDVIVFTGDLVNNYSQEAESWIPYLKKLKAPYGKFAVLGNHDYGKYGKWNSKEEERLNFKRILEIYGEMGFKLLRNEHVKLQNRSESIGLIGVENWGVKPFPQLGDVTKAKDGTENIPFKILLSHDPSHWDHEVLKYHPDIDLTLSGHTHGAQFGIELGSIKWSPVKYKYPRWAGMYREGKQSLYVNRGFGYIGFPGRVGIPPEITLFELKRGE